MKQFLTLVASLMLAITLALPSYAVNPDEMLADPVLEHRARDISQSLRCVVCQNQSIDDSNAPLAKDLRVLVRERLSAGDSDRQAIDFIVARYGNFVLLKPPFQFSTVLLWLGPALLLGLALFGLKRTLEAQARPAPHEQSAPLSAADEKRLASLLEATKNN
ncbi:MAG: cytochrome c-type biogenesis protein CcmH [Proteobacteria bacterium]|nr:cytochrome c-type biogenesis protein CcmH [Pseudomonadota bacterium]